ncbi:MAG: serine/threonine protein kinase, partial [Polyangiaceae bacterium]|nr:serine/threonine protein kinase [Polyangiaceae bacterium]
MGGLEAASDPFLGHVLDGRYAIEERLGEGGLGVVYRAKQTRLGRPVAVKVLHAEHAQKPALRARFEREARSLGTLIHPNIVQVIDYGIEEGAPFLVMELLEGRALNDAIRAGIEVGRAWEIGRTIVAAVAYAHARRVVHRDLKPANVFLQRDSEGKEITRVLDFGLAKFVDDDESDATVLTKAGSILGTPAYMSPEQAAGGATDERSDVYSLGIVLFELLTGQRPFQGSPVDLLRMHLVAELPTLSSARPGIPNSDAIDAVLRRATAKSVGGRYADAAELLAALDALPREGHELVSGVGVRAQDMSLDATMIGPRVGAGAISPGFGVTTQPVRTEEVHPPGAGQ